MMASAARHEAALLDPRARTEGIFPHPTSQRTRFTTFPPGNVYTFRSSRPSESEAFLRRVLDRADIFDNTAGDRSTPEHPHRLTHRNMTLDGSQGQGLTDCSQ
jgi:hypothetical protein